MPIVRCRICASSFYVKPSHVDRGWGKYCSITCRNSAQRTGTEVLCFMCNTKTYKTPKDVQRSKSKKYFCSKKCQTIWRNSMVFVGAKHANWTGGASVYRDILKRAKVLQICQRCQLKDKRVLAVHHVDHNRKNNSVENLAWLCHNCHFLIHHDMSERQKFMVPIA